MGLILKIAAGIIVAVIILTVGCSLLVTSTIDDTTTIYNDPGPDATPEPEPDPEPEPEPPDPTWVWVTDRTCSYSSAICWQIDATTPDGCDDGLYAELQIMSPDDIALDYTNASAGRVAPGQTVRLTFDWFPPDEMVDPDTGQVDVRGHISEIHCY